MLDVMYPLNAVLMLALPLVAVALARRHLGASWRLLGAGALTFVLSQVVHIPLNAGVAALFRSGVLPKPPDQVVVWLLPVALGLSAGLCEEIARYVGYRRMAGVRSWRGAVGYGVGHGGIEAALVAIVAVISTINLFVLRSLDLGALGVPADQLEAVTRQVAEAWSAPWWTALAGTWERVFTLVAHASMSVLVLQAFRRGIGWLGVAVGAHALLDAAAVYLVGRHGLVVTELAIAAIAVALGALAWSLRDRQVEPPPAEPSSRAG